MKKILFAGGATGGHLYPALALAEELRAIGDVETIFLTGENPVGRPILENARVRIIEGGSLPRGNGVAPLRGGRARRALAWGRVARSLGRTLTREGIDAVVALGGRPGVLPGLWARWHRRPLFLLEQNRVLGRANRLLLPAATRIFLSFDDTAPADRLRHGVLALGCPVRRSFRPTPLPGAAGANAAGSNGAGSNGGRANGEPVLLVLGGSQGARDVNEGVPRALARARRKWRVVHICGAGKEAGIAAAYREAGLLATVRPFLQDPAAVLAEASLVVARAGGSTIAELTAVGRGSLLLPYPHHRDRQQFLNADALVAAGGGEVVSPDPDALAVRLDALRDDAAARERMAAGARSIGRPDAARDIAEVIATHLECDGERRRDALGEDRTPRALPVGGTPPVTTSETRG